MKGWRLCGCDVAPPTQEVGYVMGCALTVHCNAVKVLVAMFVDFQWVVSKLFNRMVLFWVCPGPSLPAWLPVIVLHHKP